MNTTTPDLTDVLSSGVARGRATWLAQHGHREAQRTLDDARAALIGLRASVPADYEDRGVGGPKAPCTRTATFCRSDWPTPETSLGAGGR